VPSKKSRKVRRKAAISKWPKLLRVSEEMRQWSAMLGQELSGWPGVTSRPMFGLAGFYRDGVIFAGLPCTRALNTANSIIFKFDPMPPGLLRRATQDPRIDSERAGPGAQWYSFELSSANDLRAALWWLNRAYEKAKS
jgi:hypothetical protein